MTKGEGTEQPERNAETKAPQDFSKFPLQWHRPTPFQDPNFFAFLIIH
jgi:hypothetical protein